MTFILMANRHFQDGDQQEEIGTFPTREAAELAADDLSAASYIHDENEVRRATYVIIEDRTSEPKRTGEAADGDRTAAKPTRAKASTNRSAKRKDHHVAD